MGIYGIIRMILPIVPSAVNMYGTVAIVLCIIGIIYGGIIAIQQKDLKTLIAFSSLSHVGLIGAGVFAGNAEGLQGAVIQMFNHGINVIGMFMLIDIIERITGTRLADSLGGLAKKRQSLAIFFMIVLLGSVGLPLTNGFIGEFTLLLGVFKYNAWLGILAGTTIIIGAVYMLNMYRHIFFGDNDLQVNGDMTVAERISLSFISILIIVVGLFPIVITWFSADSVNTLISGLSK
jgi:NADH-quinone oxidoreductase subunit M